MSDATQSGPGTHQESRSMILSDAPNLLFVIGIPAVGLLLIVFLCYVLYRAWERMAP